MENEQVIREQMGETRASLTDKLETLEHQVVDKVQGTTTAVRGTVEAIKESVEETVSTVKESVKGGIDTVKDWLDVKAHVERHPWLMTGGSTLLGYCLGKFFPEANGQTAGTAQTLAQRQPSSNGPNGAAHEHSGKEAPATSGSLLNDSAPELEPANNLVRLLAPEVKKLQGLAIGSLLGTVREMVVRIAPQPVDQQLREIIDSVTQKLGGELIPSSAWAECPLKPSGTQSSKGDEHEEPIETKMGRPLGSAQRQDQEAVGEFDRQ